MNTFRRNESTARVFKRIRETCVLSHFNISNSLLARVFSANARKVDASSATFTDTAMEFNFAPFSPCPSSV